MLKKLTSKWILYIPGYLGYFLLNSSMLTMLIYRYDPATVNHENTRLIVPSALVGAALLVSRIGGAVSQPIVGHMSDRLRSIWGRRRPFIGLSTLPLVVCFILLFSPITSYTIFGNFIYLVAMLCLFYLAIASYIVPYVAWLHDLAPTSQERVNLSSLMGLFGLIGNGMGSIGAPWLTQEFGFQGMAITIGCISSLFLLMPLLIKEDYTPSCSSHSPLLSSWKLAWQNFSFRLYILGITLIWIAVSIMISCIPFLSVVLLEKSISFGAVVNGIVLVGSALGFNLVVYLTRPLGKRLVFQISMILSGFGLLTVGILPEVVGTNLLPWLVLLFFISLGLASFFMLPNAMLPDLIIHGQNSKKSNEGEALYFGIRGFFIEMGIGLGSLLAGVMLMLGKTQAQPLGVQLAFPLAGFLP
ncbi:MAG: MFS transporter [Pleurocapsa sp. CRU_1_2]|nr:MFS transporter [Pleurocapsa sp. CRU_1_2]